MSGVTNIKDINNLAKNNLKKTEEAMNELKLMDIVKTTILRIEKLETQMQGLQGKKVEKAKPTKIGRFEPYIQEVLKNGKIWSTHSIAEAIRDNHPDLPHFTHAGVQGSCGVLAHKGIIEKVSHGNYRRKVD